MTSFHTIKWIEPGLVSMIDQRKLPHQVIYNEYNDSNTVACAIKDMVIRGAPAIGAAAAFGLALVPVHDTSGKVERVLTDLQGAAETLRQARPTAVNLFWAIDRVLARVEEGGYKSVSELREVVLAEALNRSGRCGNQYLTWQPCPITDPGWSSDLPSLQYRFPGSCRLWHSFRSNPDCP